MLTLPVETVIFDLDGTLRHNVPSANDVQYSFAIQLGIPDKDGRQNMGARWSHYYWAQSVDLVADLSKYGDMNDAFWTHYSYSYLKSLGVSRDKARELAPQLFQHMKDGFEPENHVSPSVLETLQAIKDAGYCLGLVSNRSRPCQEECEALGLLHFFDFAYVAAEVDAWKPDPAIFNRAMEISGTSPERMVYIGDNYYADIIGAQNAGIQPVLFDPENVFPEVSGSDGGPTVIRGIPELVHLLT